MDWQIVIVGLCVAVAAFFMGRRLYRCLRNRGGCSCDCEKNGCGRGECDGSGCPGRRA